MTINSVEYKSSIEKFNNLFWEIAKKYWIQNFEELKSKDLTKEDIKNIIEEYHIIWEDKYNLMDLFHEMTEEKLKQNAIIWAKAAIIMRNLSHNLWNEVLRDDNFDGFVNFCWLEWDSIKWKNKFKELFIRDSEKMDNHPLNQIYKNLRKQWLSPYEAIINLPWDEEANSRWKYDLATSNDEIMEGSKMWSTMYCTWRINTILWILALNEWIDYVNKHFKYAEVLRDWLCDIMDEIPFNKRDDWYLNESLNYEEPHQMLIFIDENWNEYEIDTNQIILNQSQSFFWMLKINNVKKKYDWNAWERAYEMYFLDYINNELKKSKSDVNKENAIKKLIAYNEFIWWSEAIIKRLIAYAIDLWDVQLEKKYIKKLEELWEKYPCIKEKFSYHIAMDSEEELEDFIHKKYWPQFTIEDVFSQYN